MCSQLCVVLCGLLFLFAEIARRRCSLFVVRCSLFVARCRCLFAGVVRCSLLLFVGCRSLFVVVVCYLIVVHCSLFVFCPSVFIVHCLLFVVCCRLPRFC